MHQFDEDGNGSDFGRAGVASVSNRSTLAPMSIFGKPVEHASPPSGGNDQSAYGIGDLIRLLKSIPIDHHPELVVQVIKTTLESVGVSSSAVVEDALIRENGMREAVEMLESQIVVLMQEIEARRFQIAQLQVELRETMHARNLLASADGPTEAVPAIDLNLPQLEPSEVVAADGEPRSLPPPLPPPRRKTAAGRPQA
jgi:hypothetical protein